MERATKIRLIMIVFSLLASIHTVAAVKSMVFERQDSNSFRKLSFNASAFMSTHYGLRLTECSSRCAQESACKAFFLNEEAKICTIVSAATRPLSMSDRVYMSTRVDKVQCPQDTHVVNFKHFYTGQYDDEQNNGIVQTVNFTKTRNDTALRVLWFATTRSHSHSLALCGCYYITFNGNKCTTPGNIDITSTDDSINDDRQLSELDGICYDLPAGIVKVSIVVDGCLGSTPSDSLTGWLASRSMWVYELNTAATTATSECSALPLLNTQYYNNPSFFSTSGPDRQLWAMTYEKVSSDTILRVKWQGTAKVFASSAGARCGRWYITVNGSECSPKVEFIVSLNEGSFSHASNSKKTRTLEGFCNGLSASTYIVALRVGYCYYGTDTSAVTTGGSSSGVRFTVTEVRLATTVQAITTTDGKLLKIPFFNLQQWTWYLQNSISSGGIIVSVGYNKVSDTSGLHLRAVGGKGVYGTEACCRWYFTINGVECTNPGAIEGVSYMEFRVSYDQPGVVDGVCYGLGLGSHSISFNVGRCSGFTAASCYTGWGTTLNVIVEEVQPDSSVICSTPFSCP